MLRALVCVTCLTVFGASIHRIGFLQGRNDTIRQLFSGEKDFKQYLTYRKQQMEDRHEG